jgi:hypothetical protein
VQLFVATLGEVIFALAAFVGTLIVLVRAKWINPCVAGVLAVLLVIPLIVVSQSPWRASHVVGEKEIGGATYVLAQSNDGGGLQMTTFWFKDGSGMWREYAVDPDNVYWRTVGFHAVASNRVEITRFGVLIGSFDPIERQYSPRGGQPFYATVIRPTPPL